MSFSKFFAYSLSSLLFSSFSSVNSMESKQKFSFVDCQNGCSNKINEPYLLTIGDDKYYLCRKCGLKKIDEIKPRFWETNDAYLCPICLYTNIIYLKQMCYCAGCKNLFCKQCIEKWLKQNNSCPNCRGNDTFSYINSNTVKDSNLGVKNLNTLKCELKPIDLAEYEKYLDDKSKYETNDNGCNSDSEDYEASSDYGERDYLESRSCYERNNEDSDEEKEYEYSDYEYSDED